MRTIQYLVLCQVAWFSYALQNQLFAFIIYSVNLTIPWLNQTIRPKRNCPKRQEESQPRLNPPQRRMESLPSTPLQRQARCLLRTRTLIHQRAVTMAIRPKRFTKSSSSKSRWHTIWLAVQWFLWCQGMAKKPVQQRWLLSKNQYIVIRKVPNIVAFNLHTYWIISLDSFRMKERHCLVVT